MRPSHRSTLALLASLCFVDFLFLYPGGPHEMGIDSFVFHGMATSLSNHGYALWILNPLSYLGLYPLSEPSGSVFFVVVIHSTTSLQLEGAILFADLATAVMGTLGAFVLAREFSHKDSFALLAAVVMSTTPGFVYPLQWQVPTRIMFTALIPVLIWSMIQVARRRTVRRMFILATVALLMTSFHRLTVLVSVIVLALLGTLVILALVRMIRMWAPEIFLKPSVYRNSSWLAVAGITGTAAMMLAFSGVLSQYSVGEVASGTSVEAELLNLVVSLSRSSGLLLPLALLGAFSFVRRRAKGFAELFMVFTLVALIPTLFLRQYTGFYTIPLATLFTVAGLDSLIAHFKSRRARFAVVAVALGVVLVSSNAIVAYDLGRGTSLTSEQYNLGLYSAQLREGNWIFANGLYGARMTSISGRPYLPIGGATTSFQGPELLTFGFVNRSALTIRLLKPSDLTIESDSMFSLTGVQAEADWATLLASPVNSISPSLARQYSPRYLVADTSFPTQFYAYGNLYDSPLLTTTQASRYEVYADGSEIVWYL